MTAHVHRPTRGRAAVVLTAFALLAITGCGDSGAVATHTPSSRLGEQMAKPAADTLALVRDSAPGAKDSVSKDATTDVSCPGGHRREYAGKVTGPLQEGDDQARVRNRLSMISQAGLRKAGAKVTTELGKDASDVPAQIDFEAKPSDPAQARTYRTTVKLSSGSWTWTIHGQTACVTGKG